MRALAVTLLLAASCLAQRKPPDTAELESLLRVFFDVYAIASQHAAEPPALDAAFYEGAVPGMLRRLDPHSVFFGRDQFEQLKEMEKSVAKGFGSVVSVMPGRVIILQTQEGSPSQKSGLLPGDEMVAINNIPLASLDMDQLIQVLSMTRQRQAQLHVRRQGTARLLTFLLTPAELAAPSVDRAFLLAPGVGYVHASSFELETGKQLRAAIEKLGGQSLKGLLLDLRGNPGGVLGAGLETASFFLKPGTRLLSARGRSADAQEIDVPKDTQPYAFKLAVLVDSKTGSASEIVAGAVQDNDRGVIVGEPTYGKGLVQNVYPLSEGTGLALTTAFYYTPSGRSIQKPLRSGQLEEATAGQGRPEHKTVSGRIVRGGGGIEPDHVVPPRLRSRLGTVLEASAAYTSFATHYLQTNKAVGPTFSVTPQILEEFKLYLSQRNIRPSVGEWSLERPQLIPRLQQEVLNQAVSIVAGDEVEMRHDPVVLRALGLLNLR